MTAIALQRAPAYSDLDIDRLLAPLGGMARFVAPGERVLLKVNLLSAREPATAVTTHPEVVRAVARAVRSAGGRPFIGDSPSGIFTRGGLQKAYRRSGLEAVAHQEGIDLNWDTASRRCAIAQAVRLKKAPVCRYALEADKIIALPKLKTHAFQYLTLACKVMYGAIPGLTKAKYHAQFPRRAAFADALLDIMLFLHPVLYVMDGIVGMQGQGPGSGDPVQLGWLLAATDPVALDITVCRLIGVEPVAIPVLKRAKVRKLWPAALEYPLSAPEEAIHRGFRLPTTTDHLLTGRRAAVRRPLITERCIGCGECAEICPPGAIHLKGRQARVDDAKCIRCYCCHEVCPERAIELVGV